MKDPYFAHLMFMIEELIFDADIEAKENGITFKDSQIQSVLAKAKGLSAGKHPLIEDSTETDRFLKALILRIDNVPTCTSIQSGDEDGPISEEPLKRSDWILAIETTKASLKVRKSAFPGSRTYLDYLQIFVKETLRLLESERHRAKEGQP